MKCSSDLMEVTFTRIDERLQHDEQVFRRSELDKGRTVYR